MSTEIETQINKQEIVTMDSRIEAILFVSSIPVSISQLSVALDTTSRQIEKALITLEENLDKRGLRLVTHRGKIQLTTANKERRQPFMRSKWRRSSIESIGYK